MDAGPAVFKNVGSGLPERHRHSSPVGPLFVGLTAKIVVRKAGDERGLVSSAVFKTVCGALLRRPGWVRFPSIPAKFGRHDSQDDSHKGGVSEHRRIETGALDLALRTRGFFSNRIPAALPVRPVIR